MMVNPDDFSALDFSDGLDDIVYWSEFYLRITDIVTKVGIGISAEEHEDLIAIEYAGDRAVASGPAGDHISLQTVLNTVPPIGILHHHKWFEIVIGIRQDEFEAFFNTNVSDSLKSVIMNSENAPINYFAITQKARDGTIRTLQYDTGKTYLAGLEPNKLINEEGKYITEAKFIYTGGLIPGLIFYDGLEDIVNPDNYSILVFYDGMEED